MASQAKALSTLRYTQDLLITKWTHKLLLAPWHMNHIGQAKSDPCLSCLKTIETAPHIFACASHVQWQATFLVSLLHELLAALHPTRVANDPHTRSWYQRYSTSEDAIFHWRFEIMCKSRIISLIPGIT